MAQDRLWIKCRICGEEIPIAGQYDGAWSLSNADRLEKFFGNHSHETSEAACVNGYQNFETSYESKPPIQGAGIPVLA
jgi:hypothetical protein